MRKFISALGCVAFLLAACSGAHKAIPTTTSHSVNPMGGFEDGGGDCAPFCNDPTPTPAPTDGPMRTIDWVYSQSSFCGATCQWWTQNLNWAYEDPFSRLFDTGEVGNGGTGGGGWGYCSNEDPQVSQCLAAANQPCYIPSGADDGNGHTLVKDAINAYPQLQNLGAFLANKGVQPPIFYNTTDKPVASRETNPDGSTTTSYKDAVFNNPTGHIRDASITVYTQSVASSPNDFAETLKHEMLHAFYTWYSAGVAPGVPNIPPVPTQQNPPPGPIETVAIGDYTYTFDLSKQDDHDRFEHIAIHDDLFDEFDSDDTGALAEAVDNWPRTNSNGAAPAAGLKESGQIASAQKSTKASVSGSATIQGVPAGNVCNRGRATAMAQTIQSTGTDGEDGIAKPDFVATHIETTF